MEPRLRPRSGAPPRLRWAAAVGLTLWTLLQAATMVMAAMRGGAPPLAFAFFATGLFTIVLGLASYGALRWAVRGDPASGPLLADADADAESARHTGLSGEVAPPTRW